MAALIGTMNAGGQPGVTADMLSKAQQTHAAAVQEAADAYRSAIESFTAVGGSGDAQDKITRLTDSLNQLVGGKGEPAGEVPAGDAARCRRCAGG